MRRILTAVVILIILAVGGFFWLTTFGAQEQQVAIERGPNGSISIGKPPPSPEPGSNPTRGGEPKSATPPRPPDPGLETNLTSDDMLSTDEILGIEAESVEPQEFIVTEEAIVMPAPNEDFIEVPLYFGTNRQLLATPSGDAPADQFNDVNGPLRYGFATVTLPKNHQRGVLESQGWFAALIFEPNPAKHVILRDMYVADKDEVFSFVQNDLANQQDAILLYVHGFNTSLDKATRRAGQLTYDLDWNGPSFLFSWPSQGAGLDYFIDSTLAERSYGAMAEMLEDLTDQNPGQVVVIAHSMGTRVLSHGLARLAARNPDAANKITSVILAAPDIDEEVFRNDLAPQFRALTGPQFTIYASAEDSARTISKKANGFPRIGDTTNGVPEIEGIEVIDASTTQSNFFEHTYFAESTSILSDVYLMIQKCTPLTGRETVQHMAIIGDGRPVAVSTLTEEQQAQAQMFWQINDGIDLEQPIDDLCAN